MYQNILILLRAGGRFAGVQASGCILQTRDGITRRIRWLLDLVFLSPELADAILQGRQPVGLTVTRLTELDLPDVEPSFAHQFLDIAVAQGEAEIKPDRVLDDLGREAWRLRWGSRPRKFS